MSCDKLPTTVITKRVMAVDAETGVDIKFERPVKSVYIHVESGTEIFGILGKTEDSEMAVLTDGGTGINIPIAMPEGLPAFTVFGLSATAQNISIIAGAE